MFNPTISIIVPCYNGEEFLRETLLCLQKQTVSDWECVIVNDGSTDGSSIIAQGFVNQDNRYTLINKQNGGLADARNVGIKASHGKYILPLDADDLIHETYAQKAVDYLECHSDVKLVYCRAKYFGDKNEEWILPDYDYDNLLFKNQIFCSCVYRRCDYDKTGGYNSNMTYGLEDWDFLLSLLNKDSVVYRIPEILFFYRKHGETMSSSANLRQKVMYNQVIANHIDIYFPYLYSVYEIHTLRKDIDNLKQSLSFRVGCFLLKPLRLIKNLFRDLLNRM